MLNYSIKRLLYFIPTLFLISIITFFISINAPGDPVETMLNRSQDERQTDKLIQENSYVELRHNLGLDLPVFYFSITSAASCDTLYKISNLSHRSILERMAFTYGNWKDIACYYQTIKKLEFSLPKRAINLKYLVNSLYNEYDSSRIGPIIANLCDSLKSNNCTETTTQLCLELKSSFIEVLKNQKNYMQFIPAIHWYGFKNQYHHWLKKFICGDFGISYQDKRPVSSVIWDAFGWTLTLSLLSMLIAYLVAIPLGVISAVEKDSLKEKSITSILFMLYSLPNFWIATLTVVFLCGGDWFSWFPSPGADWPDTSAPIQEWVPAMIYRLTLPLLCWTYSSLAFISRQMRGGMLNVLGQDYIRTARAKGMSETRVVWKHAFRNSLLPVITLFANVFPLAITGSFVIEYIFSIPGMGKLTLEAFQARNYPVIFTVMMFTAILTLAGNLIADILYAFTDPRISFTQKRL